MTAPYSTILISEPTPHIRQVTLDRPEVCNAINIDMMNDLLHFWKMASSDQDVRCIVITGVGKAFCAGADIKARKDMDMNTWMKQHSVLQEAMLAMIDCPIPIIAAVNGAAFGGGLELALASDFIYAAESAKFALSEVTLGIMPGAMGTQNLPRACGLRRAKELCLTGKPFTAAQALEWGIINSLCSNEALLDETIKTADTITNNAPLSTRAAKKAMNLALDTDIKTGYRQEVEIYNTLLPTEDRHEGINAFNEKRRAYFQGK